jgi:hypothetical protein
MFQTKDIFAKNNRGFSLLELLIVVASFDTHDRDRSLPAPPGGRMKQPASQR